MAHEVLGTILPLPKEHYSSNPTHLAAAVGGGGRHVEVPVQELAVVHAAVPVGV